MTSRNISKSVNIAQIFIACLCYIFQMLVLKKSFLYLSLIFSKICVFEKLGNFFGEILGIYLKNYRCYSSYLSFQSWLRCYLLCLLQWWTRRHQFIINYKTGTVTTWSLYKLEFFLLCWREQHHHIIFFPKSLSWL